MSSTSRNVGILALEVYFPRTFIRQSALEQHSQVPAGKYTAGLGQEGLALTGDVEDINSIALTVVQQLLEKYSIDRRRVGRLEVGTETLVDKSKSTKTVLMDLFPHTDIEGATVLNACYGGTAALLNAVAWCSSLDDDDEINYAIVVAADIATYAAGPARPTCGVGAVALLIGRDAPLSLHGPRATHAAHVYDFYKPDSTVEYPVVDGVLSQVSYYRALESVYAGLLEKLSARDDAARKVTVETLADYYCFHAPYNKLVQKSYARLFFVDARRRHETEKSEQTVNPSETVHENGNENGMTNHDLLQQWLDLPIDKTYIDKRLEASLKQLSQNSFTQQCVDANFASQHIGNSYTASVFMGLASLLDRVGRRGELTADKIIAMFSYGSGAIATLYRLQIREPSDSTSPFTLDRMISVLNLTQRLDDREQVHPNELDYALDTRARMHRAGAPYTPVYPSNRLFPGTYYLQSVDARWRRTYARVPLDAVLAKSPQNSETQYAVLAPPIVLQLAQQEQHIASSDHSDTDKTVTISGEKISSNNKTSQAISCVITGTAAGLPGKVVDAVFSSSNMDRLIRGEQCVTALSKTVKNKMLEKNIIQMHKNKNGTIKRITVDSEKQVINLAAQLQSFDLTASYGVPPGLAQTMDVASQLAVAAGLEALKNAGLVSGKSSDSKEWRLDEQYRNGTGVVYASSFPALDAAVGEVMRFLQSKSVSTAHSTQLIATLRSRFLKAADDAHGKTLSEDDEAAFQRLASRASETQPEDLQKPYEFDRKFLFRVLVLGNAQLAQLTGCRGPNTQTNAACAGTTQAIAMAQDMLVSGRAQRVVVVAGDNASGDTLMPWLGSGFCALGAATTKDVVEDAALPFDKRRSGLLIGAGGIGLVLETEQSALQRKNMSSLPFEIKAKLLHTQYSNSAFHGAALDRHHIGSELMRFLSDIEAVHGISKAEIAMHGVYFSHETCTHASDATSCAGNEVAALRFAFGNELLSKLLILNTKGFTGHPMGVSFEDVTAVEVLLRQTVPPVPNYKEKDDYLGDLHISQGGPYSCRYALRFAAGFGSQVAFALYATA